MLRTVTPALRKFNKQDPNEWAVTSFLSPDGMELITETTTFWDEDGDLVLQKEPSHVSAADIATLRFVRPIDNYQFIELDVYSINDNKNIEVAFVNDYAHYDPSNGSFARALVPFTIGRVKTFRFPYVGEIEALVFKGFVTTGSFIVKDVRFFSRPPQFQLIPPLPPNEIELQFGYRYMDLVDTYAFYQRPYQALALVYNPSTDQWEFTFVEGPKFLTGSVSYNFMWEALTLGLLRVGILQEGLNGVGAFYIQDQLEDFFIQASSDVMEFLMTLERPRVDFTFHFAANTLPPNGMTIFMNAFMIEELVDTSVFGLRMPRMGANQQVENHMMNLRGMKGDKGDQGIQGLQGYPGPATPKLSTVEFNIPSGTNVPFAVRGAGFKPSRIEFRSILVEFAYVAISEGSYGPILGWDIVTQTPTTPLALAGNTAMYWAIGATESASGLSPHCVHIINSLGVQICILDVTSVDSDGCTLTPVVPTVGPIIVRALFFP